MSDFDVAVVGAGTAGLHAWRAAIAGGANAVMIEAGERGSTCTATGCIPSKLLLAAARAAAMAREAGTFGVDVGPVRIDGARVLGRLRADRDRRDQSVRDEYRKIPAHQRIRGRAHFHDAHTLVVGEKKVSARAIIIATGSIPIVPDFLEPVRSVVHTNETIFEIDRLPETLAVIGAGPLGLELAQAFARLGVAVTVLDKGGGIGAVADREAEAAARTALARDIVFRMGVDIAASMQGDRALLQWSGDESGTAAFDMVLSATGRAPNVEGLALDRSGLEGDKHGVPVFDHQTRRCGESDIYLAGDVDGWRTVLHEAARGGTIAGEQATGQAARRQLPALAIAFTEPNIATIGMDYGDLPEGALIGTARASDNARAGIDGQDEGMVRLYADGQGTLLGGTIVLTGGEYLAQSLALAIDTGMTAARFADQAWYHPVLEELLQSAARDLVDQVNQSADRKA